MRRLEFVQTIAALRKEGEPDAEGNETEWENDDIFDLLHSLITEAREILGVEDPPEPDGGQCAAFPDCEICI